MELLERAEEIINVKEHVKWNKLSDHDKRNIKNKMDYLLAEYNLIEHDIFQCGTVGCKSKLHRKSLDKLFEKVKAVLLGSMDEYSSVTNEKYKIVPGWNEHVKEFHSHARKYLIGWINNGRPSNGTHLLKMKEARSCFKSALDYFFFMNGNTEQAQCALSRVCIS